MPPKTAGAGGRKPMKTALISSSAPNHGDVDAGATATAATTTETMTTETETETMTVAAKEAAAATNILDKISRDCSSEELKYLIGLSILEQKVCLIAQDHLESSFDLGRSSGFIAWKKNNGQLQGSVLQ